MYNVSLRWMIFLLDMRYSTLDDLGWISCVMQLVSPFQSEAFSKNCCWLATAKYFWMPGSIVSKPIWQQWKKWVFTPMSRCLADPSHAFSHSFLATMTWAVADGETIKWLGCWIHQVYAGTTSKNEDLSHLNLQRYMTKTSMKTR